VIGDLVERVGAAGSDLSREGELPLRESRHGRGEQQQQEGSAHFFLKISVLIAGFHKPKQRLTSTI
jgi:hypothetical protein